MGDGWQSLVRLAVLDVFRQYPELIRGQGVGLPAAAKLAASLGIPWFAVVDDDTKPDGTPNAATEKARKSLSEMRTPKDRLVVMAGKLEGALALKAHADSAEIYDLLQCATEADLRSTYPAFMAVIDQIRSWCGGA